MGHAGRIQATPFEVEDAETESSAYIGYGIMPQNQALEGRHGLGQPAALRRRK